MIVKSVLPDFIVLATTTFHSVRPMGWTPTGDAATAAEAGTLSEAAEGALGCEDDGAAALGEESGVEFELPHAAAVATITTVTRAARMRSMGCLLYAE
jgi:hypothetical protein